MFTGVSVEHAASIIRIYPAEVFISIVESFES
jgi:hypothetical protein